MVRLAALGPPSQAEGTVRSLTPIWQGNAYGDLLIVTLVEVDTPQGTRWLHVKGGTKDGLTLEVSGHPVPAVGQKVGFWRRQSQLIDGEDFTTTGRTWPSSTVPYRVNPVNAYVTEAQAIAALQFGATAWNGHANIALSYAGTTSVSSLVRDGVNAVFFRNDGGGPIAEAYWWWDGSGRLVDADIVYHQGYAFFVHGQGCNGYGLEAVMAHEFGHVLGLGHSAVSTATMAPTIGVCETDKESLDVDDITGIQSLYLGGAPPPDPPPPPKPCRGRKCRG